MGVGIHIKTNETLVITVRLLDQITVAVRIAEVAFIDFVTTPPPFNLPRYSPISSLATTRLKSIPVEGWRILPSFNLF